MQAGANSELLRDIRVIAKRLCHIQIYWLKVKAHHKRAAVSVHEVINDEMGELSNTVHEDHEWQAQEYAQEFASASSVLLIGRVRVMGSTTTSLQRMYTSKPMKEALMKKYGWNKDFFDVIDWTDHGIVARGMTNMDRKQIFKLGHNIAPLMQQQRKFHFFESSQCPLCKRHEQTVQHMIKFQLHTTNWQWDRHAKHYPQWGLPQTPSHHIPLYSIVGSQPQD